MGWSDQDIEGASDKRRMKRRLIQAAALAGCSAAHADPAIPGVTGPQHLRLDGAGERRGRVPARGDLEAGGRSRPGRRRLPRNEAASSMHSWHKNKSSENEVAYSHVGSVTLGGGGPGPGEIVANSAAAADDTEEGDGGGRGSFAVHALYNHGPEPSHADGFASGASAGLPDGDAGDMVSNSSPVLSGTMSNGSGASASWLTYFPVWDEDAEGGRCDSTPDYAHLPASYIDLDEYMFRSRGECCDHWFGKDEADLATCYGREEAGPEEEDMVAPGSGTEVDADVTLSLEDIFGSDGDEGEGGVEAGGAAEEEILGMSAGVDSPAPTYAPTYEPTDLPTDAPTVSSFRKFIALQSVACLTSPSLPPSLLSRPKTNRTRPRPPRLICRPTPLLRRRWSRNRTIHRRLRTTAAGPDWSRTTAPIRPSGLVMMARDDVPTVSSGEYCIEDGQLSSRS